tara:strand:- start:3768 stop:5456 length:1689 start_codon:yes stop_codon:yes gene_type:complete
VLNDFIKKARVAYFSMEIAFDEALPTYSGGLGVLAGDSMLSAADLELPLVGVTLVSRAGYFRQHIDVNGWQSESPEEWDPSQHATRLCAKTSIRLEGEEVWICAWLYELKGHMNGSIPILLLDTYLDENSDEARSLTDHLYGGDVRYRLKQEAILGIGGERMLQALGFTISRYHMNEGHAALLVHELMSRYQYAAEDLQANESPYDIPRIRDLCCFTTHTPIAAGHDKFDYSIVESVLGEELDLSIVKKLAGQDQLNMTQLALNGSQYVNGVAKKHADVSREMFPGYHIHAITNGVHPSRWVCSELASMFDEYLPGWCHEPELLRNVDNIPNEEFWHAHQTAKKSLIEHIKASHNVLLKPDVPILGFARRMTSYKRADLLFSNIETLKHISRKFPFQIVLGGKAHPQDHEGKHLIQQLHILSRALEEDITIVFLENYDIPQAKKLIAGCDIWLNTPLRPYEASGTSGMKAAINGVANLSVMDGWWIEGCVEGQTGWAIGGVSPSENGNDAMSLYRKLEYEALPLYYQRHQEWVRMMKLCIQKNGTYFNSHRMMRRYVCEAYV